MAVITKGIQNLQEENSKLRRELDALKSAAENPPLEGLNVLTLRIGSDGQIHYLNGAMAQYLGVRREEMLRKSAESLTNLMDAHIIDYINSSHTSGFITTTVQDGRGNAFELRATSKDGFLDVVMHDVTNHHRFLQFVNRYLPPGIASLTEEELTSFKFPERRYMTVSFTDLRGFTNYSERLSPEEVRATINAYLEESIAAIESNGATLDKVIGDEVIALYGAPKYYSDHSLRAVKTACDQITRMGILRRNFSALGRQMPGCGVGINTGDMVLGNLGTNTRQNYTVIGPAVNVAERLSEVARPGEILITESTLIAALVALPEGWQAVKARADQPPHLQDFPVHPSTILPLDEEHHQLVYLIGPEVEHDPSKAEFYFQYLCKLNLRGIATPVTLISAWAAKGSTESVALKGETIAISHAERVFGRYRLVEMLGRGGMGEVWKARDAFGNITAIKMMRSGGDASDSQIQRFQREAEIMSRLHHRNLCQVYEIGNYDGVGFIAMECIEGATLAEILALPVRANSPEGRHIDVTDALRRIRNLREEHHTLGEGIVSVKPTDDNKHESPLLSVQQTLTIIIRICDALQVAHEQGVLHRDLKPGNIMIRPDGDPIVMDFGLAKMEKDPSERSLSLSNQIIGTIEYMAPEQAESSKDIDERADVYSLGAILYQMLTGRRHFLTSGNILADAQMLQLYEPPRPRTYNAALDPDLETIVLKALRPDRSERYRSAAAFKDDIERYRRGEAILAREVSLADAARRWLKRNRSLAFLMGGLLSAMLITLLIFIYIIVEKNRSLQQTVNQIQDLSKRTAPEFLAQAQAKLDQMDALGALEKVTQACELDPKSAEAWLTKARILIVLGRFGEAATALQNMQKAAPDSFQEQAWLLENCQIWEKLKEQSGGVITEALSLKVVEALAQKSETQMSVLLRTQLHDNTAALLRDLRERLIQANPGLSVKDELKFTRTSQGVEVSLKGLRAIKDIAPLRGLPISKLNLEGTAVSQLDPLRGMPIRELEATGAPISDLRPLTDMPLINLNLDSTRISDISALAGMPLKRLNLAGTNVDNLSPLKGMDLDFLDLSATPIDSLSALRTCTVRSLSIAATSITDVSDLRNNKIKTLNISSTQILDVTPLQGLPIEGLVLSSTPIRDLSFLRLFPLTALDISHLGLRDISPLRGLKLKTLNISNNPVSDISLLADMPLTELNISGTSVSSLQPLKNLKLERILLNDTEVSDLSPLHSMKLKELRIIRTAVSDLAPISGMPLEYFAFTPARLKDGRQLSFLRQIPTVRSILPATEGKSELWWNANDFWQRYDAGEFR